MSGLLQALVSGPTGGDGRVSIPGYPGRSSRDDPTHRLAWSRAMERAQYEAWFEQGLMDPGTEKGGGAESSQSSQSPQSPNMAGLPGISHRRFSTEALIIGPVTDSVQTSEWRNPYVEVARSWVSDDSSRADEHARTQWAGNETTFASSSGYADGRAESTGVVVRAHGCPPDTATSADCGTGAMPYITLAAPSVPQAFDAHCVPVTMVASGIAADAAHFATRLAGLLTVPASQPPLVSATQNDGELNTLAAHSASGILSIVSPGSPPSSVATAVPSIGDGTPQPVRASWCWEQDGQGAGLRLWLGVEQSQLSRLSELIETVQRFLRSQGVRLLSLVCNGQEWLPVAQTGCSSPESSSLATEMAHESLFADRQFSACDGGWNLSSHLSSSREN